MTGGHDYNGPTGYGLLVLVVGPSGVGKDTLLDAARERLAQDKQFCFPRRCITRPAGTVGEIHIPVRPEDFGQMARQGAFLLSWKAHDLGYGIPRHVLEEVEAGKTVIVNVSRSVIDDACELVGQKNVRVVNIRASAAALRKRLEARGREDALDIERRLARASAYQVDGDYVVHVDNDADLETGILRFIRALELPQPIANRA
ncbi:phosphonate metabolism protein/1,5-bisphosphokinase (PRPP-forming) PhnN [Thalassospira sp.]|uniref:phosphonate metabolism protein/1,5-bisphosphokinase (PRPP-forming) PhnN n=1 Tax=Thalassospira sp. TaxID=1912094 RepID=UPI001B135CEC|nr:phosphonate metabolism protein/1,5-bisphosphokinase (PRPP-forming) PhnN [Thalassospira sp.]MBO6807985.1 phosphonate metabolism protein/1,5-bisphosphokinase (PRPP-forming) PhnN [Thalassospira sp.]MBO6842671.1 phosphonate metabolism protein/1,5-bisphosphokinase (PRPP-forming) PhnN [Thalassospira sp.]